MESDEGQVLGPIAVNMNELDKLPSIILDALTYTLLDKALENFIAAQVLYSQLLQLETLTDDQRSFVVRMNELLTAARKECEEMVHVRALAEQARTEGKQDD